MLIGLLVAYVGGAASVGRRVGITREFKDGNKW